MCAIFESLGKSRFKYRQNIKQLFDEKNMQNKQKILRFSFN